MRPNVSLEFSHLFAIDDDRDDSALAPDDWLNGGDAPDPVGNIVKGFAHKRAGSVGDAAWDEPMTPTFAKGSEPFSNPLGFSKSSIGYKLRVTRVEDKTIGDEKWAYAYSNDELVEARLICE